MKRKQALLLAAIVGVVSLSLFLPVPDRQPAGDTLDSSYPSHPSLSDCREVEDRFDRQFCISDVAELKGNATLCSRIGEKYGNIRRFCEARINLNESKCRTLNDPELVQSCLESIEMTERWER